MLITPLIFAHVIQAANDSYSIKITSPKDGASISSNRFQVSVAYEAVNYPRVALEWHVYLEMHRVETDPATGQEVDMGGGYTGTHDVSGPSGTYTINVDFTQKPQTPGKYVVYTSFSVGSKMTSDAEAERLHITPNIGYSSLASDKIYINYLYSSSGGIPATVDTTNPSDDNSSGSGIGAFFGIAAAAGVIALIARTMVKKKNVPVKTPPKNTPAKTPPKTRPAGDPSKSLPPAAPRTGPDTRPKELIEAEKKYVDALKSKKAFDRMHKLREAVYSDDKLVEFIDNSRNSIIGSDGLVDSSKVEKLEGIIKNWVVRDKINQGQDYTTADAWNETFTEWKKFSYNLPARIGLGIASGGASEFVFLPVTSISTMGESIMQDKSTAEAVTDGLVQTGFEIAYGEALGGLLKEGLKYSQPYINSLKESYKLSRLAKADPNLASEVSTINQLAKQTPGQTGRNTFMKNTEVAKLGETPGYELNNLEKSAIELNNNPTYRKLLADKADLVPNNVKEIMGTAKQKVYQQARNNAIGDTMNKMANDGINTGENPFFIKQTGTHAQPGNPGFKPTKSDFDHSIDFTGAEYNKFYEDSLNLNLNKLGTSAEAMDINVYGAGTSSRGAYTGGGSMKFVENYNQTTGSDVMIRAGDGKITVSLETPQTSTSLLSKMKPEDIPGTKSNFQDFYLKGQAKGGSLENQIVNGSKEVSRMNKMNYVENFQNTGQVSNFKPPDAAKVANLVKEKGYSVDNAINKVGYSGGKTQLLKDFNKIMGL